jgi:hypothetical protein
VVELCAKLSIENLVDICQSMDSILFFLFQELNNLLARNLLTRNALKPGKNFHHLILLIKEFNLDDNFVTM